MQVIFNQEERELILATAKPNGYSSELVAKRLQETWRANLEPDLDDVIDSLDEEAIAPDDGETLASTGIWTKPPSQEEANENE